MLHVDQPIGREDAAHRGNLLAEAGRTAALPSLGQCGGICQHGQDMGGFMGGLCGGKPRGSSWTLVHRRLSATHHSDARKAGRVNSRFKLRHYPGRGRGEFW